MLSERAKNIKSSPTLSIDTKAKTMKAQGLDVINFGVGEPDFDTPEHIKEAAIKAIKDGFTKYTAVGGIDELKDAIINKLKQDNSLEYERDEIIVSSGAKHSLYNVAQALYSKGDEVLIPAPYWVSYPEQVILNDATPIFIQTYQQDGFTLDPDELEKKITKNTKALILNSPSNPTGMIYDKKKLEKIAEIVLRHNLYVISDEIYEKIIYDGFEHTGIASLGKEIRDRSIVINGLSKSHAMTGWRIGYTAGPCGIIKAMTNIQSQSTSNPTSIAQKAAVSALTGQQYFTDLMRNEFDRRRKFLVESLNKINGITCIKPMGAFYVFPNISALYGLKFNSKVLNSSLGFATYLLEEFKVAIVHGEAFGDDKYIRISYATSMENIEKGLERIKNAVYNLTS